MGSPTKVVLPVPFILHMLTPSQDLNTMDLEVRDFGFEMLDMPDMAALPWVPASQADDEQGPTSIYVPPGVQTLIDSESSIEI